MALDIDEIDRKLLAELQRDGTLSVDQLSERVALSRNACWRRVKRLEEDGVITGRVALVDADKLGLGLSVFILVRTSNHGLTVLNSPGTVDSDYRGEVKVLLINLGDEDFAVTRGMIYTFDERLCAYSRKQDVTFQTIADGQPYAAVKVTVTDSIVPSDESCDDAPPEASSHDISVTYHWDKKTSRYVKDSDAFEKLAAENEKRF